MPVPHSSTETLSTRRYPPASRRLQTACSEVSSRLNNTHVQSLSKTSGAGNQSNRIPILPPFFDKQGLIHIKYIILNHTAEILMPDACDSCHLLTCALSLIRIVPFIILFRQFSTAGYLYTHNILQYHYHVNHSTVPPRDCILFRLPGTQSAAVFSIFKACASPS